MITILTGILIFLIGIIIGAIMGYESVSSLYRKKKWPNKVTLECWKTLGYENKRDIMNNILEERITDYLCSGGLFNPELMNPNEVRELLMDCQDELRKK